MRRGLALLACAALAAASARAADPLPPPGYHPALSSDEAGLWMQVAKAENDIKTSPALIRDAALNAYVGGVVCRVSADYCGSVRTYIVDVPAFNAYSLPNGAIIVWSGLLLRTANEAQLAFVLGHEITHYRDRHSLDQFERAVHVSGITMAFQLAMAGIGLGLVGSAAQLAGIGAQYAHTRDQERDADAGGFAAAAKAGYDPRQAAAIWRFAADEANADPHRDTGIFFASHPAPEERLATLDKLSAAILSTRSDWIVGEVPYRAAMAPFEARWVAEELGRGAPQQSVVLFQRLAARDPARGLFQYALGEAYRRRGAPGDDMLARTALQAATRCKDAPPESWRGLGLIAMRGGDKDAARAAFRNYRAGAPGADDKAMIDFYLAQL